MVPDQRFAADLESVRHSAGLSLRELARATGVPRSTLSDTLAGRRFPRLDTVLAIVRACGADPEPWRQRWATANRWELAGACARADPLDTEPIRTPPDPAHGLTEPPPRAALVPAQLPRDIAGFTSREPELARLDRGGLIVIHGRPGVGKTALAVHWGHSVSARYPDGQLFLNLRGHHATLRPMSPVEAMSRLLGSLDMPWVPLTEDPEEGASLWRSALAGRRVLIMLDDALSADQVRPLVPGAPGCAMIVTSRRHLADLIVHDGADGIVIDVLPAASSVALLAHVVGAARVDAEPEAVAAVAASCGHLPLALRLAGAVLAGAPERSFAELAEELAGGDRLAALEGLARPSAVEGAFELSYRALGGDAAFLFRRLGLHPGPDISVAVAALLAGVDQDTAGALLRSLAEAHLIEPTRSGRYRIHDLLHAYAARLVGESDSEGDQDAARRRLLDWYVDRTAAVSTRLDRGRERLWVPDDLTSCWAPTDDEAAAWLDAEHRNVIAAIEYDARFGTGQYAWTLVDLISGVLFRRRDVSGLLTATDAGLAAARRHGDQRAEGAMCLRRGWLRWRGGQPRGAAADFTRARQVFQNVAPRRAEASALRGLSTSHSDAGQLTEARRYAEQALAIYRAEGDRNGEATTLNSLAVAAVRAADFAAATRHLEDSLALHREAGSRGYVALALANLADTWLVRGAIARAIGYCEEAVRIAREVDDGVVETVSLVNGARAYEQAGAIEEARRWAAAALGRAQDTGYRFGELIASDALATAALRAGDDDAHDHRTRALRLAREVCELITEAEVLLGVARDSYHTALADPAPAGSAFQAAYQAAQRALDAALAVAAPHLQAEAHALLAACDLGLGKVVDALAEARQAVEMHTASGARLAEATARCILAFALFQDADHARADVEWCAARDILDRLAVPDAAPVRQLVESVAVAALPLFA